MRIVICDDHKMVVDALSLLLESIDGIEVVSKHYDGKDVLVALELDPTIDIVLSDLQMEVIGGIELTLQVRRLFPHVKICLLTVADEPESIKEAIRAGADGYVLKNAEREELEKALRSIYRGHKGYTQPVLLQLAKGNAIDFKPGIDNISKNTLTPRELDVLRLIVQEYSGTEIAEKLFISSTTVETHRKHLMQKLAVQTTVGLVKYAIQKNLV
jgi:DNA-binding NarL/FixJ family response regulator